MAQRGAKPKPRHLRLVDGTHRTTRHGDAGEAKAGIEQSAAAFGALERPKSLKGHALTAWKQWIEPAAWLDGSRQPAAILFCRLWSEYEGNPVAFQSARIGQLRALMSELGLTDERNRVVAPEKQRDEFFD